MHSRLVRARRLVRTALVLGLLVPHAAGRAQQPAAADHSQEAVVIERSRTAYRFEQDGTGTRELHARLKIQSEAGVQQFGQLVLGYNSANERPDIAFVRVHKPDGTVVSTPLEGVQDLSSPVQRVAPIYTDFRQKHVTVQGLRPGDTLEFRVVTNIHTPLAPGQFWTEYDFNQSSIILDEQLDIDVPSDRAITLKTRDGFEPAIKDAAGRRLYQWTHTNLKREEKKKEDEKPTKTEEPVPSAVRLTTFHSWEQVGRWYASLEQSQRTPTPEIRKKAAELVAGKTTDLAKLEALYEFVATNFRYVSLSLGAGRYQPRAAADVLREQYGDCKDKHTLLASLIDAAGFKASAVLINSSTKLDPSFPSPSQFDHVITRALVGAQDIWVDTTTEVAPFRLLAFALRNKQALVIDAAGAPRLETTPADPPMQSLIQQEIDGALGEGGKLDARVRMAFRGDTELLMRSVFRSTPAARWKELLEQMVTSGGITGDVTDVKVSEPAAIKEPFSLEFTLAASRYANWTSKRITIRLPLADDDMVRDTSEEAENDPVKLGAPSDVSYKLTLRLPAEVTARAPLPVSISRDYADYSATYAVADSTLTAQRLVTLRKSELPSDRRQDYAAFARVVAADARQALALETTAAIASTVSSDMKAAELARQAQDALDSGDFTQAIALYTRVVELEPKHKTAWTNLGRAHMGLRDRTAAIAAYSKQIELNPYDAYAYNFLGQAYASLGKYDEAEQSYKKQLEVNPLDRFTHSGLGTLYLERRKYDLASVHLEKAIALAPENAWLHVWLGKAQLNSKRESEALASFDKAVGISPTPPMWNDIAYELALRATHLDRAQQYAESAVSSTAAASRNLDVARADDKALDVVRSLAAYWDTLGWVYFARGDMARAERYVDAAWRLSQHAEVGEHLGQIFEKTGRRDDAVRAYALGLVAERPSDELKGRLAALVGGADKVDAVVAKHRDEYLKIRTLAVAGKGAAGTAEFVVLLSASTGVEHVRFTSGDEALRPLAGAIANASFGQAFPDDAPAKILRRGVATCTAAGACTFTLVLPDDAQPVK